MQVKNQQLEHCMEQLIGSRSRKQGCLLLPCLFNLYTEHIIRNTGLDDLQAGIRIGGRNINNLRYVDDTTLKAESKEETKEPLDQGEGEESKRQLKTKY